MTVSTSDSSVTNAPLPAGRGASARGWGVVRALFGRPASSSGASLVILFLLLTLFAPWIAPYSATEQIPADARQAPSAAHIFGADRLGRDVFSRIVWGTREVLGLAGGGTLAAVGAG